ncbi:MAG: hypothetical protein GX593_13225 [Actinomycetales bacterium]|nr:hypothetical protein [Actinomycetales bacterium]
MARVTVQTFERAVLHQRGAQARVLEPGRHRYRRLGSAVHVVDLRPALLKVSGQELLTSDGVGVKASLAVRFRVEDALAWVMSSDADDGGREQLHLATQLAVRSFVGGLTAEELLGARAGSGAPLTAAVTSAVAGLGVVVEAVDLRDLSFPGELRGVFARAAIARQEGAAALERARAETAALRSLANAARLLDSTPGLRELRTLQAVESGGGTVVLKASDV